jgi:hypothetical protein
MCSAVHLVPLMYMLPQLRALPATLLLLVVVQCRAPAWLLLQIFLRLDSNNMMAATNPPTTTPILTSTCPRPLCHVPHPLQLVAKLKSERHADVSKMGAEGSREAAVWASKQDTEVCWHHCSAKTALPLHYTVPTLSR